MALNSSGPISFGGSTVGQSINLELGVSATALASINSTSFRTLAGVASGQISLNNFYGKSNTTYYYAYQNTGYQYDMMTGQVMPMSGGNILAWGTNNPNGGYHVLNKILSSNFTLSYSYQPNGQMGAVDYYGTAPDTCYANSQVNPGNNDYYVKRIVSISSTPSNTWYRNIGGIGPQGTRWKSSQIKTVDASDNVYISMYEPDPSTGYYRPVIVKLNSSGTIVNSAYTNSAIGDAACMAVDPTTGRLVVGWERGNGSGILKQLSFSVFTSALAYYFDYGWGNLTFYHRAMTMDTSSNAYFLGFNGDIYPALVKINVTTGAYVWGMQTLYTGSGNSCAGPWSVKLSPDQSFVYITYSTRVVGESPSPRWKLVLVKLSASTGAVQWQREWALTGWSGFYNGNEIPSNSHLFVTSDAVYIGGQVSNNGGSGTLTSFYAKLNPDGSGTGSSYAGPSSNTFSYTTASYTWTTYTQTSSTTWGFAWDPVGGSVTLTNNDAGPNSFTSTGWSLSTGTVA